VGSGDALGVDGLVVGPDDEVETVGLWVTDGLLHALSGTSTASASPAYTARLGRVPSFTPITASKRE
jgi:hypothetical protein